MKKMKIIYCDISFSELPASVGDTIYTQSPLTCLSLARIESPDYIFLRLPYSSYQKHAKILELCGCLRIEKETQSIPIAALVRYPHRRLIDSLRESRVEIIACTKEALLDHSEQVEFLKKQEQGERLTDCSDQICPYLHYESYNETEEITLCGAYKDRLVINNLRLLDVCTCTSYHSCEYYLQPRVKQELS